MATAQTSVPAHITHPDQVPGVDLTQLPDLKIYSHSRLFYWWPVWVLGYILAILTYAEGVIVELNGVGMYMHPSKNPGVIYTVVFMLVILFTNISLRGVVSVVAILTVMFVTVLFAYLGWWEEILRVLPYLSIHMNLGFYVFFSTFLLIIWVLAFFVFDRLKFWRVRPGQLTVEYVIGGAERSYDTRNMIAEQLPQDLFRNQILGLGSGDIRIVTSGPRSEEMVLPNVLFVRRRIHAIQKLVQVKPDQLTPSAAEGAVRGAGTVG